MKEISQSRKTRRIVVYSAATVFFTAIFFGIIYGLRPMLLPFILGAFLAYLFKPLARSFRGSSLSKYIRAGVLLYFIGLMLYWSFSLVKSSLPDESEKLQLKVRLQYRLNERYQSWMGLDNNGKGNIIYQHLGAELDQLKQKALTYTKLTDEERKDFLLYNAPSDEFPGTRYYDYFLINNKLQNIDGLKLKAAAKEKAAAAKTDAMVTATPEPSTLASLLTIFSHWIIMPLAFIFILLDKGQIIHFFLKLIPNRYFELTYTVLEKVDEALGKYIRGTMIECFLVGLSLVIGFYLCGFELKIAALIGIIGGLTNAIPFVGTFIACLIGVIYSLIAENVHSILPFINENNLMLAVVGVVMVAHLLDNAIFQPLVVGSAVNIHPLVVILGVFGGSLMFGFAGLIFAIPTIVVLKVVTETFFSGLKDYRII